ncbi:zinc transporter 1-like [Vigna radiata var. radiata]|uniref:Zinc transporter 1-like n=1 Tax=Vigna radiata var. radiata TaxID=3916 RepID=A0A3Q0EPZ5_VIGRR|nr:zinc transporter 1-like [Vigna radiata var. radiata]
MRFLCLSIKYHEFVRLSIKYHEVRAPHQQILRGSYASPTIITRFVHLSIKYHEVHTPHQQLLPGSCASPAIITRFVRFTSNCYEVYAPLNKYHEVYASIHQISRVTTECTCDEEDENRDRGKTSRYKITTLVSILIADAVRVCIPLLGKVILALSQDKNVFFLIKAFVVGVILATRFIHILPDVFANLTSPCLKEHPWEIFPSLGIAMGTLMVDTYATAYLQKYHSKEVQNESKDVEKETGHEGHVHAHTHAIQGHVHGPVYFHDHSFQLLRHRVISHVLELGIIVHSVIIGISLGASKNPNTIRPLVAALTFHQFFEGMGLGNTISQANFKRVSVTMMGLFFALTTPIGIGIGIGISSVYDDPITLIVEGVFNAASARILIYMALIDLLAHDFMSPRIQQSSRLCFRANVCLLLGAGLMSLVAKWA